MDLTEEQGQIVAPRLPVIERPTSRVGRPWQEARTVLKGILWVLRTGAPWKEGPAHYPPYQTCHRRLQGWCRSGARAQILRALARDLEQR